MDSELEKDLAILEGAKTRFFDELKQLIPSDEKLSQRDMETLSSMLRSKAFKKAAGIIYRDAFQLSTQLLSIPLHNEENVRRAVMVQGRAAGIVRAFEALFDMIDPSQIQLEEENNE